MTKTDLVKEISDLELKFAGKYDPINKDYKGKYMTCFYFTTDFGIPHCHCTHKYFDTQDDEAVQKIIQTIDQYFKDNPDALTAPRKWVFDKFEMFGPEKDTPVLRRMGETTDMFPDLKQKLDAFRDEEYPVYKPHITLEQEGCPTAIVAVPVMYALVTGNRVIKSYKLG